MKAKAIADVLYSNPQFRALLHDGSILARDVLSDVVEATATAIAPEESDLIELEQEARDVDGRAIKDDVEDTKRDFREGMDSAKANIRQTYDQATTSAMETLAEYQKQGQKFGNDVQAQTSRAVSDAKHTASELASEGQKKLQDISESARESVNAAIAKLEQATGVTQEDIKKQLDEGVSVDDILQKAKKMVNQAGSNMKAGAQKADLQAGKMLSDAKQATNDFADRNDLKERASDAAQETQKFGQQAADQVKGATEEMSQKTKEVAQDVEPKIKKGTESAKDQARSIKEAAGKAGSDAADEAHALSKDVSKKSQSKAAQASDKVSEGSQKAADATTQRDSSKMDIPADSTNHLKQIGIIHTDEPEENQLQAKGIIHPDPKYTFDDTTSTTIVTKESATKRDATDVADDASSLVKQVIAQIQEKVKDIQGISQDDLEAAARDLIEKTSQASSDAKTFLEANAKKTDQQAGEIARKAGKKADDLQDKAQGVAANAQSKGSEIASSAQEQGDKIAQATSENVEDAKKRASKFADEAGTQASQLAEGVQQKSSDAAETASHLKNSAVAKGNQALQASQEKANEISEQLRNIDQKDLQDAVNNLLKVTKEKLEQTTGIKAEDARQSLDWAIKRGEELAEQAMRNGRQTAETVKVKSSEAASAIQQKSTEVGRAMEDTAVTVGAQTKHALQNAPRDAAGQVHETLDASQELMNTAVEAVKESTTEIRHYLAEKFPPKRRAALRKHFQGLAVSLRDNSDYSNGLDGLISIARKYIDYTLTFTEELPSEASDVVSTNDELDQSVRLTLKLIERFSNGVGFNGVQSSYNKLKKDMQKEKGSDDFLNDCMTYFKRIVQDMKYAASEDAEKHGQQLLDRVDTFAEDTGFKQDVNDIVREMVRLAEGFASDKLLFNFISRGQTLFKHLVMNESGNFVFKKRVMKDFFNIIMPSALKMVQYIPISRIEFQNADVDFLIENLVFESSSNHDQSFLPYRLQIDNHNSVEFLNAYKFESDYSNKVTIKVQGLTMAVRDAGFYIRKKTGFWRFTDSGLVDLVMDGKGIDIDIDLQMSTDEEEEDVTKDALFIVKDVRVNIHKLDFSTSGTKHGWLVGLVKPFIRGFIKRQVGLAVGEAMKEQLTYYEYQLRMFQHRIKTAYIANNGQASFESFFRAIFTANAGNNTGRKGQFEVSIGKPGPLAGIFTKASLQQELEDAELVAAEHGRPNSWKNDIFDLGV